MKRGYSDAFDSQRTALNPYGLKSAGLAAAIIQRGYKAYRGNKKQKVASKAKASRPDRSFTQKNFVPKQGQQIAISGGESKSFCGIYNKIKPMDKVLLRNGKPSTRVTNAGLRCTSLVGRQNSYDLSTALNFSDLTALSALFASSAQFTSEIFLDSVDVNHLITNQESSNARFTLYDILVKTDTIGNASGPSITFQLGGSDLAGGLSSDYLIPGTRPEDIERFTKFFKIVRKTDVILSPGATHNHVVKYAVNKRFQNIQAAISGSSVYGVKGITYHTMIIHSGTPMNDVTTKTSVSLGAGNLSIVSTEYLRTRTLWYPWTVTSKVNSLPTTFAVNPSIMQDDGDVTIDTNA